MTLGELLENLYTEVNIELKEHDGLVICRVGSKSSGLGPYKGNSIGKWFPYTKGDHTGLVVYLDKPDIEGVRIKRCDATKNFLPEGKNPGEEYVRYLQYQIAYNHEKIGEYNRNKEEALKSAEHLQSELNNLPQYWFEAMDAILSGNERKLKEFPDKVIRQAKMKLENPEGIYAEVYGEEFAGRYKLGRFAE